MALVYSAKRDNGPLGAGWGLSFESSIERKSKYGGIADMSADDTYWIDGQKLIEVEDGSYRTEQNDFTVYTKVTGSSGLTGWRALKDGFTRHYGISAGAGGTTDANAVEYRNETSDSGTAAGTREVRWHLSKTKTAFGVEVSYRYIIPEVRPNGETSRRHLPGKIIYAQTSSGWNEVSFAYEERNDIRVSYANGPKRTESKRLRSITVQGVADTAAGSRIVVSDTVVSRAHEYLLIYGNASHSPQSLLTEVKRQEVVSRLTVPGTIPGTQSIARFSYADSETTWGEREPITLVGDPTPPDPQDSQQYFTLALPGDVDGDARPDLVVLNDICHIEKIEDPHPDTGDRVGDAPSDEFPPVIIPEYTCVTDHRVYLNTIVRSFLPGDVVTNARRPVVLVPLGSHVL
ncbi:MAG: hypothetical protein ACREA0_04975 [bacterium]